MGVIVGAAAVAGARSGGRSAFCQGAVDGFGLHGLVHLARAAAVRGRTPGSVTSPLVVPVLRPARARDAVAGLALAAGATVVAHGAGRRPARAF